ncbi:AMP-binding enzyme [Colletotrichum sp. SAR 10_86]|nr:AMP-binding enzyme [Colletotrichum sp. SAR 10_77]KAI8223038.1 AMP-binding enzyme [Colletotrichum sp. SAR 10_86]
MDDNFHPQDEVLRHSLEDPEGFWSHQAEHLHWHKKPTSTLKVTKKTLKSGVTHDSWEWFPDGEISTCFNCVDRHVHDGKGDAPAIFYDSPVTGTKQTLTYKQLLDEVEVFAGALREEGVKKGDVVLVYMPMIPAALIGILAVSRLGAIHAVVFGGFAPNALAQRIDASQPVAILTASCGIDGNKPPMSYKPLVEEACAISSHKPDKVIVWQREQIRWHPIKRNDGERNWQSIVKSCRARGIRADYIAYAPLFTGAATVLYEGKPVGTPDASAFWRIVEEYKVNTMFTAPTALRAIKRDDPENKFFRQVGERGGLRTLKGLFLAGERSEPAIITMYQELLERYGAVDAHVVDNWWSTEAGSPITGRALVPHAGKDRKTDVRDHPPPKIKPGSAGKAMPGFDVRIVDDAGNEVPRGTMGNIVLGLPLAPTAFRTLWQDEERFYKGYLKRFDGKWLDTGDAGYIDAEGYVNVMSRNEDVLNVSAHRLSSGGLEQAITSHPLVAEACVVGIPDALKGQLPFAFITLSTPDHPTSAVPDGTLADEIQALVRSQVGAIATLGGLIQGKGMIPKTRSGKTLRRVLRELLDNAVHGEFDKEVQVPSTVEDAGAVEVARAKVREYWEIKGEGHKSTEARAKL